MPRPLESMEGHADKSRMLFTVGASPGTGSTAIILCSASGSLVPYASRNVNDPRKAMITVPGALPGLRSTLKGPPFHECHGNVDITISPKEVMRLVRSIGLPIHVHHRMARKPAFPPRRLTRPCR